jgi:hypothetical protein
MGARIPHLLKIKVLNQWLNGMSRDDIAINNKISGGSVSNIIQDFKNDDIPDIDLLRGVAVGLKKQNLDLTQFARSMRLRKILDNLELPEDRIENFLEHLCIFFYKHDDKNVEKFLLQLEFVYDMATSLDLSIYDILGDLDKKKAELIQLDKELTNLKQQIEVKNAEFVSIIKNTEKYIAARRYGDDHQSKV